MKRIVPVLIAAFFVIFAVSCSGHRKQSSGELLVKGAEQEIRYGELLKTNYQPVVTDENFNQCFFGCITEKKDIQDKCNGWNVENLTLSDYIDKNYSESWFAENDLLVVAFRTPTVNTVSTIQRLDYQNGILGIELEFTMLRADSEAWGMRLIFFEKTKEIEVKDVVVNCE